MSSAPGLRDAYAAAGPEGCRALYCAWAASYDAGFAAGMEYRLPAHVAAAFLAHARPEEREGPLLDAGAGTGLLGQALRAQGCPARIDGCDLSAEMLERAAAKGIYETLFQADIARPFAHGPWRGVLSSGTFTAGHVGPEGIAALIAAARPGALFALSVNARVWEGAGFAAALAGPLAPRVAGLTLLEVPIYGPAAAAQGDPHAGDRARIALFRSHG
jgi:predicted TPR repeat methyltransferase